MSISNCAVRRGRGLSGREEIAFMPIDEESESELLSEYDPSDSESDSEEDESDEGEDDDDNESSLSESSSSE